MQTEKALNPARPDEYPQRILLMVLGSTPQVVTETLFGLAVQQNPPFVPTEIRLLTTTEGEEKANEKKLLGESGQIRAFFDDYDLLAPAEDHVIVQLIQDERGTPLEDIRTVVETNATADCIVKFITEITEAEDADQYAIHASFAGGRKTMGVYLSNVMSLFGRPQDRLSHVLVSKPFEKCPNFFYPPPTGSEQVLDIEENGEMISDAAASDAKIELADMFFLRLRHWLKPRRLNKIRKSYSSVVTTAMQHLAPVSLKVNMSSELLICGQTSVKLPRQSFALYAYFARLLLESGIGESPTMGRPMDDPEGYLLECASLDPFFCDEQIEQYFPWLEYDQQNRQIVERDENLDSQVSDKKEAWDSQVRHLISGINSTLGDQIHLASSYYEIGTSKTPKELTFYGLKGLTSHQIEIDNS